MGAEWIIENEINFVPICHILRSTLHWCCNCLKVASLSMIWSHCGFVFTNSHNCLAPQCASPQWVRTNKQNPLWLNWLPTNSLGIFYLSLCPSLSWTGKKQTNKTIALNLLKQTNTLRRFNQFRPSNGLDHVSRVLLERKSSVNILSLSLSLLAVQNSSIGDLVPWSDRWSGTTNHQSLHNTTEWP